MRTTYTVPFDREVVIPDHWPIPFMSGVCNVIEKGGRAKALEIIFSGDPVSYAPLIEELNEGVRAHITGRDRRLVFIKRHLEQAVAFIECLYDVDLAIGEIAIKYEGETPEEEELINVKGMQVGKHKPVLPLTFDMITRALMAAEHVDGPMFEATLTKSARKALSKQQYIDSFRYSFLLIESEFGQGKFKSAGLKKALRDSKTLISIVQQAVSDVIPARHGHHSETATLLANSPSPELVIDHLVDKRGFYFHGNRRRKDAWKPDEQEAAEALALLAVGIAQLIAQEAASPMFEDELGRRHFEDAMNAGARLMYDVNFQYREPEEGFIRNGSLTINTPGTKVTGKAANAIAQEFLRQFESGSPVGVLESATCSIRGTNQPIFEIRFHVDSSS